MADKTPEGAEQVTRDKALTKAYGVATAQLRDQYRDRFNELYSAAAAEAGYEWKPKLTPAQTAAAQFDALLAEYPELKERFVTE